MPLQVMASTKMDVYSKSYEQNSLPLTQVRTLFEHSVRLLVSDGDFAEAANFRHLAKKDQGVSQWHHTCDIHKLSNRINDSMDSPVLQAHVSGLIAMAKSLEVANAMREFREALRLAIGARLVWERRRPRDADLRRNHKAVRLCIPDEGKTHQMRRDIIVGLFTGRWERTDVVEHACVGEQCCRDRDQCVQKMTSLAVAVLAGGGPPTFPRHRWTGFQPALQWPLLLESIHGLFSIAYKLWAAQQRGGKSLQATYEEEVDRLRSAQGGTISLSAVEDVAFIDAADVGGDGEASGAAPGDASAQSRDPTAAKREENSRHRSTALRWIAQDPLGMMLVMRLGMSPICAAMDKYLACAGKRWGRKQEARAAQAFARGAVPGPAACRAFRVGMAAKDEMVGGDLGMVQRLMVSEDAWSLMAYRHRSAALRTHAALLLSTVGCGLFRIQCEHKGYPLRLFLLLDDVGFAEQIKADPPCMYGQWVKHMIDYHTEEGGVVQWGALRTELLAIAMIMELEMASVEAHHASIRKVAKIKSTQTHTEHIQDASAEWIMRRFQALDPQQRKKRRRAKKERRTKKKKRTASDAKPGGQRVASKGRARQRGGGGGSWRAFIRSAWLGCKGRPDFQSIAREYAELSAEEKAILRETGQAAAKAKRQGVAHPLGLSTRDAVRVAQKQSKSAHVAVAVAAKLDRESTGPLHKAPRRADASSSGQGMSPSASVLRLGVRSDDQAELAALGVCNRIDNEAEREVQDILDSKVDEYIETEGMRAVDAIGQVAASVKRRRDEFEPSPNLALRFLKWLPVGIQGRVKAALTLPAENAISKEIKSAMEAEWARAHTSVQQDPERRAALTANPPQRRGCREAGMCICGKGHRPLRQMKAGLQQCIGKVTPPHSMLREKLCRAEVAVLFVGRTNEMLRAGPDAAVQEQPVFRFVHICSQTISPWESWFQVAQVESEFDAAAGKYKEPVRLRIEAEFWKQYQWLNQLDKALQWTAHIYEVVWRHTMLGTFVANVIDVQCVDGEPAGTIWDPFTKGEKKKAAKEAWAKTTEEASDIDDDDDENGDVNSDLEMQADPGSAAESSSEAADEGDGQTLTPDGGDAMVAGPDVAIEDGAGVVAVSESSSSSSSSSSMSDKDVIVEGADVSGDEVGPNSSDEAGAVSSDEACPNSSGEELHLPDTDRMAPLQLNEWCSISFFESGPRNDFIVSCRYPGHKDCIRTRTANPSPFAGRAAQGRPLGFLAAFCKAVEDGSLTSKDQHWKHEISLAQRQQARRDLCALPEAAGYCEKERLAREGETDEPDKQP